MSRVKWAGIGLFAALLVGVGGIAVRASVRMGWQPPSAEGLQDVDVDAAAVAQKLAAYLKLRTVSPPDPENPGAWAADGLDAHGIASAAWQRFLIDGWIAPLSLRYSRIGEGLAVFVPGLSTEPPVLWLSHADVVPVTDESLWRFDPFGGVIADGFVHGRGALDNKASTIAQLEAIRLLHEAGLTPSRPVVLLITPDEEIGGATAKLAASYLDKLENPDTVLDEGGFLLDDLFEGVRIASVAVSEKTFVNLTLTTHGPGGHASMPRPGSAIAKLTRALDLIDRRDPDASIPPALVEGLRRVASQQPLPKRWILANADLLGPILLPALQKTPAGRAVTMDTLAPTILRAGVQDNVVPTEAFATINARLRPETDPADFERRVAAIVGPDVEVRVEGWGARAAPSSWDTGFFAALERVIPVVAPGSIVIPSATPGTMDARYFSEKGLQTYRFHPFVADSELRESIHGTDERIAVEELARGVRFYFALLQAM